jgi:hypothetical protein
MADYNDKPLPPARDVPAPEGWRAADQFDPFEAATPAKLAFVLATPDALRRPADALRGKPAA